MDSRPRGGDAGETLVELLITVAILGIAIVTLLAGFASAIRLSNTHREQANGDVVLEAAAEAVKAAAPAPCSGATSYATALDAIDPYPAGWTRSNVSVTACAGAPLQTVTIQAAAPGEESSGTIDVVKRVT